MITNDGDDLIQPFSWNWMAGIGLVLVSTYLFFTTYIDYEIKIKFTKQML
ncbi:hypothetical protein [Cytobacillus horneckiae]